MAHSKTADLPGVCRSADILVAAIGRSEFVKGSWIKPGAVVIDVGISRTDKGLKGDVEFSGASQVASWITPVPGGVGVMTVAMLLANTVCSAEKILG
jgi:methylenetetrahydrofolate dehydrogenase (NADP+)/methenyltetrahydrofolate cyclohydrolase